MGFLEITKLVFQILWFLFGLALAHNVFFILIGVFIKAKKYPATEDKKKYAILVAARNEEKVIGALIDSIRNNDYPQEKLQIFVIAHNCSDRTAEIARERGATVYVYDNPNETTKGYALRYLIDQIGSEYGIESFDGFYVFDADNVLRPDFFSKMNDAFVANGCKDVVRGFRNSANFGHNYMSFQYGIHFLAECRFESRGRTVCGCSTRVSGTGYVFPSSYIKDGYPYVTLTEDWEFSADSICNGRRVVHCDDAEFFDEQPTGLKIMLRQRLRWSRGRTLIFFTRFGSLMKSLFTPKRKGGKNNKFSQYDITSSILPNGAVWVLFFLCQLIATAISPLFGYNAATVWVEYAISMALSLAGVYVSKVFYAVLLLILERKRLHNISFGVALAGVLLYPIFLETRKWLDTVSLFTKNLGWKTIPHEGVHGRKKKKAKAKA